MHRVDQTQLADRRFQGSHRPAHFPRPIAARRSVAAFFTTATICALHAGGCVAPQQTASKENSRISIVQDRGGAVRLDGIGPIRGFAKSRDTTFMHCLELVLEALGRKIGYDELMGLSGTAFRAQFRSDRWDVGNGDPLVGEDCLKPLFRAIGMQYAVRVVRRDEMAEKAALRREIKESIDRGIPVLAANIIRPEDWGIITGYRSDGTWLCRAYHGRATKRDRPSTGWPTAVVLLTRKQPRPPRKRILVESIRRAVRLHDKRRAGNYALGSSAFDAWIRSLRSAQGRGYIHPNIWTFICLMDARAAAVRYLRTVAEELGSRKSLLLKAADFYDQEVRLLQSRYRYVPSEQSFPDSVPPAGFRERQIETLKEAKSLDDQAIATLRSVR